MWEIKGTISKGDYNYALVPGHPKATDKNYVLEHRVVMENYLGRLLKDDEVVHHKDGNKKNNDIKNLEVMSVEKHSTNHAIMKGREIAILRCPNCGETFVAYKNKTFLEKPTKYNCTFCSSHCRGQFCANIQYHGITKKMRDAIKNNLYAVGRLYDFTKLI